MGRLYKKHALVASNTVTMLTIYLKTEGAKKMV
jgi:hypothetical protein